MNTPMFAPVCVDCPVRSITVFEECSPDILQDVAAAKTYAEYAPDEYIFRIGEEVRGLYCIHHGCVQVLQPNVEGELSLLRTASPGDLLGLSGMLEWKEYPRSAIAVENVGACFIPLEKIRMLLALYPDFTMSLMKRMCQWINETGSRSAALSSATR